MNTATVNMIMELLSGLALFLFGMNYMSHSLQQAAGGKLRVFLDKCTKNRVIAALFGTFFTALIQSSGATTVMVVGFVNAGILPLVKSVGLIFGANIGTTITSQIVSLKLTAIAPFIAFIGAAIIVFGKRPMVKTIGAIIFGFGSLFLGINFMTEAMDNIQKTPVASIFKYLDAPIMAIFIGFVFTVITQSSSVTVSVLVLLAGTGLVEPVSCLYFVLGAYVGATTPAVLAALNSNRNAKRAAFIHVMFNVVGMLFISVLLIFFKDPIIDFLQSISADNKRFVANADLIFKTSITLLLLPFANYMVKLSKLVIHAKPGEPDIEDEEMALVYINEGGIINPPTALVEVVHETERMALMVRENLKISKEALIDADAATNKVKELYQREKYIDYLSHRITEFLVKANQYELPIEDRRRLGGLFHVVIDVERIGDHAENIIEDAIKGRNENVSFSEKGIEEIETMFDSVLKLYDTAVTIFANDDMSRFETINDMEDQVDEMQIKFQEAHVSRMAKNECSIEAGLIFTDLVIGLERIGDHATNIAYSIIPDDK